jgi:histone acetyltransferase (RNA polymerase elongator complex component)
VTPFVIPVFLPQAGCPHRCVFCDQSAISGAEADPDPLNAFRRATHRFLSFKRKKNRPSQVSFYGGNFLGQSRTTVLSLLEAAEALVKEGKIDSIRFSTRPDSVAEETLELLEGFAVKTIELGVQSMDDGILSLSGRGHSALDTERAVFLLKERGYETVAQLMTGLPDDDGEKSLFTARKIGNMPFDFARIYPVLVFKDTVLASWLMRGRYTPPSLEESVRVVADMYRALVKNRVPVIRIGLQGTEGSGDKILAGPRHPAFGHLVLSKLFLEQAAGAIAASGKKPETAVFKVHPGSISKMTGMNKQNIRALKERFGLKAVRIIPDDSAGKDEVRTCL